MTYSPDDLEVAKRVFDLAYRHARERAASRIDGNDLTDEGREHAIETGRFHCGTCTVNDVIAQIEPSIIAYISTLEEALAERWASESI
jgi:hypothetical protein